MKNQRRKIPQQAMVKAKLQQAICSRCPFCSSEEVGHFEIHHIDEDPSNNQIENLILICPTCHSKITKGEILQSSVLIAKEQTSTPKAPIEIASIATNTESCGWLPYNIENSFYNPNRGNGSFPILKFSFINHFQRTVLLKGINLDAFHLPRGLSGLEWPRKLKSSESYEVAIPNNNCTTNLILNEELEIPAGMAFKFEVVLFQLDDNGEKYPVNHRVVLNFSFVFNNRIVINSPEVCLNCKSRNEEMVISHLS